LEDEGAGTPAGLAGRAYFDFPGVGNIHSPK